MNTLAYSIITIPDFVTGSKLHDLQGLDNKGAAKALFHLQAQKTGEECLPSYLQQIAAIAVVLSDEDGKIQTVTLNDDKEADILNTFFDIVQGYEPVLVTWDNDYFTSEVINYRSIKQALQIAPHYEDKANHFNLNEALVSSSEKTSIDEIATLLGLPSEETKDSRSIWESYLAEDFDKLNGYCEGNAMNSYQIYLRYQLTHGNIDNKTYADLMSECADKGFSD
ncbi:MAG TPA: hypothetical protein EYG68_05875 [Leucothrix mucor]|nr:hypothetical protein [Leucothrix mucor]